jgi:hypothetical protein
MIAHVKGTKSLENADGPGNRAISMQGAVPQQFIQTLAANQLGYKRRALLRQFRTDRKMARFWMLDDFNQRGQISMRDSRTIQLEARPFCGNDGNDDRLPRGHIGADESRRRIPQIHREMYNVSVRQYWSLGSHSKDGPYTFLYVDS